ncbi:nucleotidyltransferase family protein [Candidatus Woesearchaeota archaeon]|nr:nucleotidyltransferase family protein [Candidatus Woesearchaeota archaeon]
MKAIILAAGYATRLYPLTIDTPKPLLEVAKKAIIEYIIEHLELIDELTDIYVVTNNKFYETFKSWNDKVVYGKTIHVINDGTNTNEDRLGAVGDMHYVIEQEKIDDDTFIIGGDNLFEFNLKKMAEFSKQKNASVIAAYDMLDLEEVRNKFGVVVVDDDNKIIDFQEKPAEPKSTLAATACYLLSKEDLEELEKCIAENRKPDNLGDFIKYLSQKKPVYCMTFKEGWFDIGSHEHYKEAQTHFENKKQ